MRTLILDLGNVIACFDHRRACRQLAALSTSGVSEDDVYEGVFSSGLERAFDLGVVGTPAFLSALRTRFQLASSDDAIGRAWSDIFWPSAPMIEVVRRAHDAGVRLVLASNTNPLHFAQVRRQFAETIERFDALVLSYEVGVRKPDRVFFRHCLDEARAPADACVYVDDRPDFVEAAAQVGLRGIVCTPGAGVAWPEIMNRWSTA